MDERFGYPAAAMRWSVDAQSHDYATSAFHAIVVAKGFSVLIEQGAAGPAGAIARRLGNRAIDRVVRTRFHAQPSDALGRSGLDCAHQPGRRECRGLGSEQ